ncbi:MAG: molybdopterin-dependent oxidoreductase [Hyphomicrobiaceae bacterium]|nr:molybdopterin-dependent oxidoreductase [Hyphomicrobiaceae bacterium]
MDGATRTPAFCTQCRSRCGCVAVVEHRRLVRIEPLPGHPSGEKLCPKGRAAPELVYHADRLTQPMRRTAPKGAADPGWVAISWEEALDEIARRMGEIRDRLGPEAVAFSVTTPSGTHIQDGIAWVERFIRAFGSPNTIYATEICNWHKDHAARFTYGSDIGTPDFANTDCILLWGNNPATTWLARNVEIQKGLRRGAKMIVIDPRPTMLARRATQWLQPRSGSDLAVALGLANLLLGTGRFDKAFARRWSNGPLLVREDTGHFLRERDLAPEGSADVLLAREEATGSLLRYDSREGRWLSPLPRPALSWQGTIETTSGGVACRTALSAYAAAAAQMPPERVAALSGVAPADLASAADIIASAGSVAYYCWNGVGQSATASQTDRAISTLYALTGSFGRRGGNVPGAAAPFRDISGQDLLTPAQRAKALGLAERPLGPGLLGWVTARDVYRAVLEEKPYPVRMLVSFGSNILVSQPDTELARRALAALDLHVHADFFLNATGREADIVLPVSTSWEREGLRTGFDASLDGLRRVQLRPAVVAPVGEARSDTEIVLGLAGRLGLAASMFELDAERGHAAALGDSGVTLAALRAHPEGVEVATSVALEAHAAETDGIARGFATPTRRIEIYSERLLAVGQAPVPTLAADDLPATSPQFPLLLGCAKTVAYCHSQHRNIAALRRLMPDPQLEMAPADAEARGIANGDWVTIETAAGRAVARAAIVEGLAPGSVFGQHGWWVAGADGTPYDASRPLAANLNAAYGTQHCDPISGSIPLRAHPCEVRRGTA